MRDLLDIAVILNKPLILTIMKIYYLILFLIIGYIYIVRTAVPINELVGNAFYCNNSLPLVHCYSRIQRRNKTAQLVTGNATVRMLWTNDVSATLAISYQDYSGIWKSLFIRYFNNSCEEFFGINGTMTHTRKRFFPESPTGCPIEPQFWHIGPSFINRYRKNWEPDLKFWIPPYFLEADNWRAQIRLYWKNETEKLIGEFAVDFRLLNEEMSQ